MGARVDEQERSADRRSQHIICSFGELQKQLCLAMAIACYQLICRATMSFIRVLRQHACGTRMDLTNGCSI
jgi:hypothetical protein